MNTKDDGQAIPKEIAFQLCEEIRREKARKWFTQCWGCVKFSKNDPAKMCFGSQPDYRGCKLVNERYGQGQSS
jgi:rRNA maturation endonuclease Nob1